MQREQLEQSMMEENIREVGRLGIRINWSRRYIKVGSSL